MNLFPDWQTLARSGYLFRIVDHGPGCVDRVTVLFSDGDALGCDRCGGRAFSQWAGEMDPEGVHNWVEMGEAVDLTSADLANEEKAHILRRINEAWRGYLEDVAVRREWAVAASRPLVGLNDGGFKSGGVGLYTGADGALWVAMDGGPEDDRGPFTDPAEALRATLPDEYSLCGPDYHGPAFPEA